MSSIVINYLNSKRKPVGTIKTDDQLDRLYASITNHVVKLYAEAAKKRDPAMLSLVDTDLRKNLYNYLETMKAPFTRMSVVDSIIRRIHVKLLSDNPHQKSIPFEQFDFMQAQLDWMKDYGYIFTRLWPSVSKLRNELFDCKKLNDEQLITLLVTGAIPNSNEKLEELYYFLPQRVKDNIPALLFFDFALNLRENRNSGYKPIHDMEALLSSRNITIPGEAYDFAFRISRLKGVSDKDIITLFNKGLSTTQYHDAYIQIAATKKSLRTLLDFAKEVDESLYVQPDVSNVKLDFDTPEAKMKYLNTEFATFQSIANQLERMCASLLADLDNLKKPSTITSLGNILIDFYAFHTKSRSHDFEFYSQNIFTLSIQNYEFTHLPKLLAFCINQQNECRLSMLTKFTQNAPLSLIHSTFDDLELSKEEAAWVVCESLYRDITRSHNEISRAAMLLASAKMKWPDIYDFKISDNRIYKDGNMSNYEPNTLSISNMLDNRNRKGAINYLEEISDAIYFNRLVVNTEKANQATSSASKADVDFLQRRSL